MSEQHAKGNMQKGNTQKGVSNFLAFYADFGWPRMSRIFSKGENPDSSSLPKPKPDPNSSSLPKPMPDPNSSFLPKPKPKPKSRPHQNY